MDDSQTSASNVDPGDSPERQHELPAYMPRYADVRAPNQVKSFEYAINGKKGHLATLTLLADQALSKGMPTYLQGNPVKGHVYLRADKLEVVNRITVTVEGYIMYGSPPGSTKPSVQETFLKVREEVWSAPTGLSPEDTNGSLVTLLRNGDLGHPEVSEDHGADNVSSSESGRSWDFSIRLPDQVAVRYGKEKQLALFSPPETFSERLARASVAYQIIVKYYRGKWLTPYKIPVPFGYVPVTRPKPFSLLRQLSYQDNIPLPGPTVDTDGWHPVKQGHLKGTIFKERHVEINCTLFLAKPLSYTRGSLIPLFLLVEGGDIQATNLLSTPKYVDISLQRRIQYHYDTVHTLGTHYLKDSVDVLAHAVLWPSNHDGENYCGTSQTNWLGGEIHISPGMKPSCTLGDFRIEYNVLVSFNGPGFVPVTQEPLITHPVEIVTLFAPGPRPRKYGPPSYEAPASVSKTLFYH